MATIKKGNVFAHAKKARATVKFAKKKPAAKKAPARKTAAKAAPRRTVKTAKAHAYKHCIKVRKPGSTLWQSLGVGGDSKQALFAIAKAYARRYPNHGFKVE